ncbi:hypothetical protein FNL37_1791 [Methylovorus glucosotrophus]|uniref:hypothetical protein n=1 Tax=Methylovorus glucosotrophus TaxID=266009 RepID=UPI00133116F4|nr:hypothetical protein [Methylovorus glucosotrophus]KAF0844347.1 hypothetical protein FNL37_1791 [Methylovorus glucosotrophus]
MRDYSKVSPQFWIGATGKKLRSKGVECQLVALYLMTCTHANMLGMYYLPKIYIAHECGLSIEGASKGLQGAIEAGFCSYDDASEVVWVHEMATYQIGEQLTEKDLRVKGVQNEYNAQPESPYLKPFFEKYQSKFLMSECRDVEAPSKALVSQEQEQEQEQEHLAGAGTRTGAVVPAAEKSAAAPQKSETELQAACKQTWAAYQAAYFKRYGTEAVRNAKVNSVIKQFVQRLGFEEAPHVAAFFLTNNNSYYVSRAHVVDCLLSDAEKLRMEWATGNPITQTKARQLDKSQSNANAVGDAMKILGEAA